MSSADAPKPAVIDGDTPSRAGLPRHFHLLWDEDLEQMREIFKAIRDQLGTYRLSGPLHGDV